MTETDLRVTSPTGRSRVVVVDDHPLVRHGLSRLIDDEPDLQVCAEADSEDTAMTLISDLDPDIVIVDLSLRNGDGLVLIKRIRAHDPDLPVLVLTMHDLYVERAFRAGAMGYLTKEEAGDEILTAIRRLLEGGVYVSDRASSRLAAGPGERGTAPEETLVDQLTDRELQVFRLIGEGLSTREIAERLGLSNKTIETHRRKIKERLRLESARDLVQQAIRYILGQDPP